MKSIFNMLHIVSIEDDSIITSAMQRFTMWETEGLDCYFHEPDLMRAYSAFMRETKENTTVEFFRISKLKDEIIEERIKNEIDPVTKQRLNYIRKCGIKKVRNFLLICDDIPKKEFPKEPINLQYHKNIVDSFGFRSKRIENDEIKEILFDIISFDGNMKIHPDMTIREQLIQKQCSAGPEYFKIGDIYCKILSLKHLPDATRPFMLSYLFDYLLFDCIFSISLNILPQGKEHISLEAKERFYIATSGRGAARNAKEADELMTMLTESRHKIGYLSCKIIVWNKNLKELERLAVDLSNLTKNENCFFEEEIWGHDLEFFRSIPSQMSYSERQHRILSPNFIDMIPASKHGHADFNGRHPLFLRNRFGEIYGFDAGNSKRNNKNGSIFGCSGSGKSVTVNALIAHTFFPNIMEDNANPGRIFIVDFAGAENSSYLKMADLYGGVFVPIDSKGLVIINPFPHKNQIYKNGKWDSSLLNYLQIVMDLILEVREKSMNADLYRIIISKAVKEMYKTIEQPVLADLIEFIDDEDADKVKTLKKLLGGFLDDPVSKIINGLSTIDYGSDPFVIYDLQGITGLNDKLKELLTFIVIQEAKKTAFEITNSFIMFDEAAQLIKDPRLGDLIEELFATARKYNTGVWTITQNFLSFKEVALSSKIKINTTTTIFLSHANDEEAKRLVASDFGFTGQEKAAFDSLKTVKGEYALALFRTQTGDSIETEIVRIELSPFDYAVATSDREDNRLLKKYAGKHDLKLIDACAQVAVISAENNIFVIDALKKELEKNN
ncbi:MAG TPA: TraM recognition domain-containing protein [bacterium]|nr:TraM recognition domain-containing protein [bacterium]